MSSTALNIWELVEPLVLDQYKDSTKLKALLKVFVGSGQTFTGAQNVGQAFERGVNKVRDFFDIDNATGAALDVIGALLPLSRTPGETDSSYRARIKENEGVQDSGTPNYVISMAKKKSRDNAPKYLEEKNAQAVVLVYTPGGRQLERAYVNRCTPAGVMGGPAAAIQFADGSFMGDAANKKFLAVADDENIGTDLQKHLITEAGQTLSTQAGEYINTEGEEN